MLHIYKVYIVIPAENMFCKLEESNKHYCNTFKKKIDCKDVWKRHVTGSIWVINEKERKCNICDKIFNRPWMFKMDKEVHERQT